MAPKKRRQGVRLSNGERETAQAKFLEVFVKAGNISLSARAAGVNRQTVAYWKKCNLGEFATRFKEADFEADDALEAEAFRRAVTGVEKPVYQSKELVGYIREFSDTLLIFLMKGRMPSKYKDRVQHDVTIRQEAERVAKELGLDADAVIAEAERIARG